MPSGAERFYHDVSLRGPVPDRLLLRVEGGATPDEAAANRLALVAAAHARAFFARKAASFAYAQSFAWLDALGAREDARHVAGALFEAWFREHGRYDARAWAPTLAAARTEHMLRHAPLLLEGRDAPQRERVFGTLIRQARHLARAARKNQNLEARRVPRLVTLARAALGTLALPLAGEQERQVKPPLEAALTATARGRLPDALADTAVATEAARALFALAQGYAARGLTPPAGLSDALGVLRLLLGGLEVAPGAGLAVLPGGAEGDRAVLGALSLLRRDEAAPLLERYGYAVMRAGGTSVHAALSGEAGGAFALSDGTDRLVTAAGTPRLSLRALDDVMRDWTQALARPAAAATLDADGLALVAATREDAPEGQGLTVRRRGPEGTHERRLFLEAGGAALIGEDTGWRAGLAYRFPLHPDVAARAAGAGRAVLTLPSGRAWRVETAHAALSVEDGIYSGGGAPRPASQLVLTAEREGVRWALRRS